MLVLMRRVGQSVMIGNDIRVTVLDPKGGQVRLGIEAPSDVTVHREEVFDRIKESGNGRSPRRAPRKG
jgi:carbon storage regulator